MTDGTVHSDWVALLQVFTNRNAGRATTLENDGADVGAQREETGYPLRGVAYDPKDNRVEIMLGALGSTNQHLTHTISNPTSIDVLAGDDGRDRTLRIEHDGGQTLLELLRR